MKETLDTFKVYVVQELTENDEDRLNKNIPIYKHVIADKTLYIEKDGIQIKLDQFEIMDVLKALGVASADFRKGFEF